MTRDQIELLVIRIVKGYADPKAVLQYPGLSSSTKLPTLDLDEVDMALIATDIEEALELPVGTVFDDRFLENVLTLGDLVDCAVYLAEEEDRRRGLE